MGAERRHAAANPPARAAGSVCWLASPPEHQNPRSGINHFRGVVAEQIAALLLQEVEKSLGAKLAVPDRLRDPG